jgi:DNA-binding MarR family transcriptional regulator
MALVELRRSGIDRAALSDGAAARSTAPTNGPSAASSSASPQGIAEVMMHIGHLADSLGYTHGLKPSQWTALRYFAGTTSGQRTVSAFADFHATTRGAASQMVEVLVNKELLVRVPVPEDRRVMQLHPTTKAQELLRHDPLKEFASVIADLPTADQCQLAETLSELLRGLLAKRQTA